MSLTEEQRRILAHRRGPLRIAAGAGTGKTETLRRHIVSLIDGGVRPGEILCLTFTVEATKETHRRRARVHEEYRAAALELAEQRRQLGQVGERLRGHAGADEALARGAARESLETPAGGRDELLDSLVIDLDQVLVELERRRQRDHGHVDLVAVEQSQAGPQFVSREIDRPIP